MESMPDALAGLVALPHTMTIAPGCPGRAVPFFETAAAPTLANCPRRAASHQP
jgi:hypothetical protein